MPEPGESVTGHSGARGILAAADKTEGRIGSSPPTVCTCGHPPSDHYLERGLCEADVYRPELGRSFGCFCPQLDLDEDR